MYGIADLDNCYCSCEKVFRPDLEGKPIVVLSNNDGCVVARSNEAKKMGINGLAEFLACGTTKAQSIMNSGILQDRNIAYRAGNRWRFNKTLLTRLLEEEPEIFNNSRFEFA